MMRNLLLLLITTIGLSINIDSAYKLSTIPGDVNQDGIVNILDVIITVNYIFEGE